MGSGIAPLDEGSLISRETACCEVGAGTATIVAPSEAGMLVLPRPEVAYSHILSFFAQGPHIGLVSSHFRCRFRHVMLQLPGQ